MITATKCCRNPNVEVRAALFASQQLEEDKALDEMMISENSSALNDADNLLDGAMNRYWAENSENNKWHFIQESNQIRSYFGGSSEVMGRMLLESSKLPFVV